MILRLVLNQRYFSDDSKIDVGDADGTNFSISKPTPKMCQA